MITIDTFCLLTSSGFGINPKHRVTEKVILFIRHTKVDIVSAFIHKYALFYLIKHDDKLM